LALYRANRPPIPIEPVHDLGVVRPSQVQGRSLAVVILVSWGIAFVEYCFAVPANRIGSAVYSPAELKTIQEVITLIVFAGFTAVYFNEPLSWTQAAGFALIALGAALVFHGQTCARTTSRTALSRPEPAGRTKRPGIRYLLPRRNRR
jgi:uncharacterized protein (DUF486 family)